MQLLATLASFALLLSQAAALTIPNQPNQQVTEYTALPSSFDGPKILPWPNATSYEWWYFDAVSATDNQSVTIIFIESTPQSFLNPVGTFLNLQFVGTYANGTDFVFAVPVDNSSVATVEVRGEGASGVWGDSGFSFTGNRAATQYLVEVENAEFGISGSMVVSSNGAPAHGPCGIRAPGASELLLPNIGWANAIPDSSVLANFTVRGQPLSFEGYGYHDKNWGDRPFNQAIQSWIWGHGRVGDYSVVWLDSVDQNRTEYFTGYVARGTELLHSSCENSSVLVRPFGAEAEFPGQPGNPPPDGYDITIDLGEEGVLALQFSVDLLQGGGPIYGRYVGALSGTLDGVELVPGKGVCEEFKFQQA